MFWKVSGSEGTRAAKGTPRGRAVGPGVVLEAEKGFGLDQLRASKGRVLPPTAENLRQQILKVGGNARGRYYAAHGSKNRLCAERGAAGGK